MNMMFITSIVSVILMFLVGVLIVGDLIYKKTENKTLKFALVTFLIGVVSSLFPFFTWGLMLGFPSVILNVLLLTLFFRKRL